MPALPSTARLTVKKVLYTAPSRLVGHRLKVRIFSDKLECWLGDVCVLELARGQPDAVSGRGKVVICCWRSNASLAHWLARCCETRCSRAPNTA
jgi:hypothetical protein